MNTSDEPVISLRDLSVSFGKKSKPLQALESVSFDVMPGETLALVGESGSGKTITSLAIMDLLERKKSHRTGNAILQTQDGPADLLELSETKMCDIRGRDIAMIFQEPMTSLNPVHTVGAQIIEAVQLHNTCSSDEARKRAIRMIELVGMPDPERQLRSYPHQLSGGMRQRVMIAMALSCNPRLLIADEPTTALDVTIQAQILKLMRELQQDVGMGMVFITHDLGVVNQIADRVCVMYSGQIIEQGNVRDVLDAPAHPYTRGLVRSIPSGPRKERLHALPGRVPGLSERGGGCLFAPRCAYAISGICTEKRPETRSTADERQVKCWRIEEIPSFAEEADNAA